MIQFLILLSKLSFGKFLVAITAIGIVGGAYILLHPTKAQLTADEKHSQFVQNGSGNGNQGQTVINNCHGCTIVGSPKANTDKE